LIIKHFIDVSLFSCELPLTTDPLFYLFAVPPVLVLGISKSGFGIGIGSLAVPLMALTVSVPQAAAIAMPVLLFVDLLGLAAFRKHNDAALLRFLIPFGLLGTVLGALNMATALVLLLFVPVGVFTGFTLAKHSSPTLFNRLIYWGVGLTGTKLLWDAWH